MSDYKDYELTALDTGEPNPFKDDYGNTWCTAVFLGIGEPVKWVIKDPSTVKVGETYYGEIKEMKSKANKPYLRFYKAKKEDTPAGHGSKSDQAYNDGMRWGNSLTNAVATMQIYGEFDNLGDLRQKVIETAEYYYSANTKTPTETLKDSIEDPNILNEIFPGSEEHATE